MSPISQAFKPMELALIAKRIGTEYFLSYSPTTSFALGTAICERQLQQDSRISQFRRKLKDFRQRMIDMTREVTEFDEELDTIEKESSRDKVDTLEKENRELKSKLNRIEKLLGVNGL